MSANAWFRQMTQALVNFRDGRLAAATADEVSQTVARDLKTCDAEQLAAFKTYQVEAFPIMPYGNGFNVSPIGPDGTVLEHWCNAHPCGLQKMLHKYQEARANYPATAGQRLSCRASRSDWGH